MFSKKATKIDKIFNINLILCSKCQIDGEDFVNFRGLLRKQELYNNFSKFVYWLSENALDVRSTYPMKLESTYFTKLISDNAILLHWCTTHNMPCAHLADTYLQVTHPLKLPYKYAIDLKKIGPKYTPHGKFRGFGSFPFPVIRWIVYDEFQHCVFTRDFFREIATRRIGLNFLV